MANTTTAPRDTLSGLQDVNEQSNMLPTLTETHRGALIPPVSIAEDFETWMAGWKWTWKGNSHGEIKATANSLGTFRVARNNDNQRLPTSPDSPSASALQRKELVTPLPTPTPDSSPFSNHTNHSTNSSASPPISFQFSSSSEDPPLFTTEYFEVRPSTKGGLGAFATKDVEDGTVILSEKPLFRASFMDVFYEYEQLSSEQRKKYLSLYGFRGIANFKVLAIFKTNRFETADGKSGIFLKSSRFNHACHPFASCTYRYDSLYDCLITTTIHKIKKGQEITIQYTNNARSLFDNYGFRCDCPGCPSPEIAEKHEKQLRGAA